MHRCKLKRNIDKDIVYAARLNGSKIGLAVLFMDL